MPKITTENQLIHLAKMISSLLKVAAELAHTVKTLTAETIELQARITVLEHKGEEI